MTENLIRNTLSWQDHKILEQALNIEPTDNVISVISSGCNILSLLLSDPKSITAFDILPMRYHTLNLKIAAIKYLSHKEFLEFLGFNLSIKRIDYYESIRHDLEKETKIYWDSHLDHIRNGIIHQGELEKHFALFRNTIENRLLDTSIIDKLYDCTKIKDQIELLPLLLTEEFGQNFIDFFGNISKNKFSPDKVEVPTFNDVLVGEQSYFSFKEKLHKILLQKNFYVEYFLTGSFRDTEKIYPYLKKKNFNILKKRIDRILVTPQDFKSIIESRTVGFYNKANLSDIFEMVPPEQGKMIFQSIADFFAKQGRIAYWNVWNDFSSTGQFPQIETLPILSQKLNGLDRVSLQRRFIVESTI